MSRTTTAIYDILALINPAALPALRIAATVFFIINLVGGAYIFRNRHRFFDRDPWFALTTLILILLISFWLA
jgi:hypothetical protein